MTDKEKLRFVTFCLIILLSLCVGVLLHKMSMGTALIALVASACVGWVLATDRRKGGPGAGGADDDTVA